MREELLKILMELSHLLHSVNEEFWNKKVKQKIKEIENSISLHEYICNNILDWYGGMGSINDLYISKENGHDVDERLETEVNKKVSDLINELYEICSN